MALTFRSLGRALTGGRPLTLGNLAKSAAPLALNAVIPGSGLVAKGLTLATKAQKGLGIAQSLFGAVKKPPIITSPPQGLTAVPTINQAGMGGGLVGGLVGAGVSAATSAALAAAMQRLQGGGTPSMSLVPAGSGGLSSGSASTGIYDRLDQALGGVLPGGTYSPWGLNPQSLTGGVGGTSAGAGVLSGQVPITTQPQSVQRLVAPPGYILVRAPNGAVVAMLKVVAYALGLRKRPTRGGGLSRREVQAARKVQAFVMGLTTARKPKMPIKKGARR